MNKTYFSVRGSDRSYNDIWRDYANIETARKVYAEMKRDGVKNLELLKVVETENYEYSVSIN